MKKGVILIFFVCSFLISGYSQTKQDSIKVLLNLMQIDSSIERKFTSIIPMIQKQAEAYMKDSASKAYFTEMMTFSLKMGRDLSRKILENDVVPLYDKYFNQSEIDDFIQFYRSPSGRKLIQSMPSMQKETSAIVMEKYMPEFQQKLKSEIEDILKKIKK